MTLEDTMDDAEMKMMKSVEVVTGEFASIRTGKASPALVENVMVDYYGTKTRLRDLAGISTPESRLLVVQPWDPGALAAVEKAIQSANIGLNPMNDGKIIRIPIPEMSEERRMDMVKVIKGISEEGRIAIRNVRRDANHELEALFKSGDLPEDEKFRCLKEIQDETDEYIKEIDDLLKAKEEELLRI
jgi:ribosome recycling factor